MRTKAKPGDARKPGERTYMSVKEAADWLSLSDVSVRRFLTQKRLRRFKAGGRTLVLFEEVKNLVNEAQ